MCKNKVNLANCEHNYIIEGYIYETDAFHKVNKACSKCGAKINENELHKNLDKDEKKQIYNEYIDTSKALHQYLIDKEKNIEKAKARKEVMKDITFGAMVLTITTTAVTLAAKGVLSVYNAIKHN